MAELCLGTVQFGMDYGINNTLGQPSKEEVFKILDLAVAHGIKVFDTAAAYGNSEELLGEYSVSRKVTAEKFKVVSKLSAGNMGDLKDISPKIYQEACGSLRRLHTQDLYGYLLHKAECIYNQDVIASLQRVKQEGLVKNIGISIYQVSEGEAAIDSGVIDFIQMPYNVFDQRGDTTGFLKKAKSKGITIFTRSAFLQGLFLMEPDDIPESLGKAKKYLNEFGQLLEEFQLDKVTTLLNYPANNPYIDYVVVGVDNVVQLQEHVTKFGRQLPAGFMQKTKQMFSHVEEEIIMPNLWKLGSK